MELTPVWINGIDYALGQIVVQRVIEGFGFLVGVLLGGFAGLGVVLSIGW